MRKLLALVLLLISLCLPVQANEQEVVDSFRILNNKITQEINDNYSQNITRIRNVSFDGHDYDKKGRIYRKVISYWIKFGRNNLSSAIDIKKTDSLITPYIAYMILSYDNVNYYSNTYPNGKFPTKELADSSIMTNSSKGQQYRFIYGYQNNQWVLSKYQFFMDGIWQDENAIRQPIDVLGMKKED